MFLGNSLSLVFVLLSMYVCCRYQCLMISLWLTTCHGIQNCPLLPWQPIKEYTSGELKLDQCKRAELYSEIFSVFNYKQCTDVDTN